MSDMIVCRMKSYIQPFERHLAVSELSALSGAPLSADDCQGTNLEVATRVSAQTLANRLSFYEFVRDDKRQIATSQVLREATLYVARNGIPITEIRKQLPVKDGATLPNRRCLRYGTHGIHEYRGKFFPQLVRSLINIAKVPVGGIVADPMCGSGTTLVEGALAQYRSVGLDMNPLSVFMSNVKCTLLKSDPDFLAGQYHRVRDDLLEAKPRLAAKRLSYFRTLHPKDQEYLKDWFAPQVLEDLDIVAERIALVGDPTVRDFMRLALSNILRRVSWQKEDDLRVRKEIRSDVEIDPIRDFLEELGRSVRIVAAFLYQIKGSTLGKAQATEGDARMMTGEWADLAGKVSAVVTSPPYATALPYLDTDRLSLCYLGLLSRDGHRGRDKEMIGNREITEGVRREYWGRLRKQGKILPRSVVRLIGKIELLNTNANVGFRRRNLPALLAKYFFDMREVLAGIAQVLKAGSPAFVVVGDNHTIAGGMRVNIETARLLAEIGVTVGLEEGKHLPMEMLVSRDIFRRNAVGSETILEFRKPC
jgi:site-specific DNA-methyltransferase (cytosine-N4-specific)